MSIFAVWDKRTWILLPHTIVLEMFSSSAAARHQIPPLAEIAPESRREFRAALEIRLICLGKRHLDTAYSERDLGMALEMQGMLKQAVGCFRRAHEAARFVLQDSHPQVIRFESLLWRAQQKERRNRETHFRMNGAQSWKLAYLYSFADAVGASQNQGSKAWVQNKEKKPTNFHWRNASSNFDFAV